MRNVSYWGLHVYPSFLCDLYHWCSISHSLKWLWQGWQGERCTDVKQSLNPACACAHEAITPDWIHPYFRILLLHTQICTYMYLHVPMHAHANLIHTYMYECTLLHTLYIHCTDTGTVPVNAFHTQSAHVGPSCIHVLGLVRALTSLRSWASDPQNPGWTPGNFTLRVH